MCVPTTVLVVVSARAAGGTHAAECPTDAAVLRYTTQVDAGASAGAQNATDVSSWLGIC